MFSDCTLIRLVTGHGFGSLNALIMGYIPWDPQLFGQFVFLFVSCCFDCVVENAWRQSRST